MPRDDTPVLPVPPNAFDAVEADIKGGLESSFSAREEGFQIVGVRPDDDGTGGLTDGQVTAVEWQFDCTHSADFQGLAATELPITIYGVTIAEQVDGQWQLRRYIDWLSVTGQLGLSLSWRPVVDQVPDAR
jgi:hypothetical protein